MRHMQLQTKTKPVTHLKRSDVVVFTSGVSGKQTCYKVEKVTTDYDEHPTLPIRVVYATLFNSKGECVGGDEVGYDPNENVLVPA